MIEMKNIKKIYRMGSEEVAALNGITLSVKKHEFVSVVGPSGSGKTTLMNIIGCLDTPTEGSYKFEGVEISQYDNNQLARIRNRKIGFIFQKFNLLPKLTAAENVELPLIYMGMPGRERKERVAAALKSVGLSNRSHHRPNELSGGQQQRVAIARALVTGPMLLLADEPTGALDSKTGEEVMDLISELHSKGNTIILITHNMEVAKRGQRIIRLHDGLIVSDEEAVSV
mgnify:CR=1 FL=1